MILQLKTVSGTTYTHVCTKSKHIVSSSNKYTIHTNFYIRPITSISYFYNYKYLFSAFTKFIRLNSTEYEVKLVDTAGQDEYGIFPQQYSMDFHGYVLVYSITSRKSFQIVQIIYDKLLDMVGKIQ